MEVIQGQVKWFNVEKGFGFIIGKDGDDVFVHYRAIMGEGFKQLREGEMVRYKRVQTDKGWQAVEVEKLGYFDSEEPAYAED